MNKKGQGGMGLNMFIAIVLGVVALGLAVSYFSGIGFNDIIRLAFPNFLLKELKIDSFASSCPVKVAELRGGEIYFCQGDKCEDNSGIIVSGENLAVDGLRIGDIFGSRIAIFQGVRNGVGEVGLHDRFYKVAGKLPEYKKLINLNDAYFHTRKDICRDLFLDEDELRKKVSVREKEIDGKKFYYDLDDYLKNNGNTGILYLDKDLSVEAESFINSDGDIFRRTEIDEYDEFIGDPINSNERIVKVDLIGNDGSFIRESNIAAIEVTRVKRLGNREESGWIDLTKKIDNNYNKLGVNTRSDSINKINFKRGSDGKLYLRLGDKDEGIVNLNIEHESDWILVDYWNAYGNLGRVPSWAVLNE